MDNTDHKEDHNQIKIKLSEQMETIGKIYVKQPHEILKDSSLKNTNDDVQRAIQGLREIPDEELQEFLDDEDFMEGLDVVDAWEGDEDRNREIEQDMTDSIEQEEKQPSRERRRPEPKGSYSREKPKREEKKREEIRRDPLKSSKDIERDKIRTKRDTETKLLAEKEKAIKYLLDSDNVVPPGTEAEAIQSITEEQNRERANREAQRSREYRRSMDRYKLSPIRRRTPDRPHRRRSPFIPSPERRRSPCKASPERRRSPFKTSAERHRSPPRYSPGRRRNSPRYINDRRSPIVLSPDRRRSPRRPSWERRSSIDRKWSAERHRRRIDSHERRRSRSRDRRSRSMERLRRRPSRSPVSRRYSPRRRSHSRSRSVEKRPRKRSPFINELARQLRNKAMKPSSVNNSGYMPPATMEEIAPLLNGPVYQQQEAELRPPPPVAPSAYAHQSGPLPPPPPPPSSMLPMQSGPPFMNFEPMLNVPQMNFESMPMSHNLPPTEYSSGPVMYNQSNAAPIQAPPPPPTICAPLLPTPVLSPQPVPAPLMDHAQIPYNPSHDIPPARRSPIRQFESSSKSSNRATSMSSQSYTEHGSATSYNEFRVPREERMKTPEPPIISKPKQFEKTSLSSLLEASVSAKDPSNMPVLYPGFKPEIMRHCEQALCQLPFEDPRLKMKGRFFYNRNEEDDTKNEPEDHISNSILLQKSKTKIYWEENNSEQQIPIPKPPAQMHQKICQTDDVETETKSVQTFVVTVDVETQVYQHDFQQIREERRPIMDRLDWNTQGTYEYASPRSHEVEDLRWSLNNSSQRRSYNRQTSPSRRPDEHEHRLDPMDNGSRELRLDSPIRNRDGFSGHKSRDHDDHYGHRRYSPDYHIRSMEPDDFHDRRSNHSRGESPMKLDESDDELVAGFTYQRGSDWHGRGKNLRGKGHTSRGKHSGGRPYRSRGNFRGKF